MLEEEFCPGRPMMWPLVLLMSACQLGTPARSDAELRAACDGFPIDAAACHELGTRLIETGSDPAEGGRLLYEACRDGAKGACPDAGRRYLEGDGVPKDLTQAELALSAGCTTNVDPGESCALYGILDMQAGRPDRAPRHFKAGCDEDVAWSCRSLGEGLRDGTFGAVDADKALDAFDAGCRLDDAASCWSGAQLARTAAPARAADLAKKACRLGISEACS